MIETLNEIRLNVVTSEEEVALLINFYFKFHF